MNPSRYLYYLSALVFLISCDKKITKTYHPLALVQYSDSACTKKIDSIVLDSITEGISGYFKIYEKGYGIRSFEIGKLEKGKKTGKWLIYFNEEIIIIENYNQKGKLDGESIDYFSKGKKASWLQYKNGILSGEQKEYYINGNLSLLYHTDSDGGYINDYLALSKTGDTLYYTDLTPSGNGYLKQYDRFGKLAREGNYINKQFTGIVKEYFYYSDSDKYEYMDIYQYYSDYSFNFIKRINM
jgi:hypothetical protein